jgi:hypothetical protein
MIMFGLSEFERICAGVLLFAYTYIILYKTIKDESDTHKLQEDLDAAAKWENDWLMQFHPDKCSVMHITTKKNPIHHKYVLLYMLSFSLTLNLLLDYV